jgi:hypothetical protein
MGFSPFTATYVRFGREIAGGIPRADHVMYDRSIRVVPARGAVSLAAVVEPYFERSWDHFSSHYQTPPDKPSRFSAAVLNGRVAYIPYPVFGSYANHANLACRWLVAAMIDRLIPEPLVRIKAPSSTEATVTRQGKRTIDLDLIEDVVPLHDVELSLKLEKNPTRAYRLNPSPEAIEFDYRDGRANTVLAKILGHEMVVFEA